jgi:hypothetical protein
MKIGAAAEHSVTFEERKVEDIRFDYPRAAFQKVRQVSELNEHLYRSFVSPWVRAAANPLSAPAKPDRPAPARRCRRGRRSRRGSRIEAGTLREEPRGDDRREQADRHDRRAQGRVVVADRDQAAVS